MFEMRPLPFTQTLCTNVSKKQIHIKANLPYQDIMTESNGG